MIGVVLCLLGLAIAGFARSRWVFLLGMLVFIVGIAAGTVQAAIAVQ